MECVSWKRTDDQSQWDLCYVCPTVWISMDFPLQKIPIWPGETRDVETQSEKNPTNLRFERVKTGILSDKKPIIHPSHPVAILHPYLQLRKSVSLEALNLNMFFTSGDVRVYCVLKQLTRILTLGMTMYDWKRREKLYSSWWFQPLWNILIKMGNFPE